MAAETTPPTAAGEGPSGPLSGTEDPPGKWEELVDEWADCAKAALDRAAERARDNVKLARAGKYGLGAWLDDMRWFWGSVSEDASHVADTVQDSTASRSRPDAGGRR